MTWSVLSGFLRFLEHFSIMKQFQYLNSFENYCYESKILFPNPLLFKVLKYFVIYMLHTLLHSLHTLFAIIEMFILQIELSLSEMLGTRNVLNFRLFWILKYSYIHREIPWVGDPGLNTKFICISYIPFIHTSVTISYNVFIMFCMKQNFMV